MCLQKIDFVLINLIGLILRMPICGSIDEEQKFNDSVNWESEEDNAVQEIPAANKDENSRASGEVPMGHM